MAANNNAPAPPAINSSDTTGIEAKDAAPLAIDSDTGMATNKKDGSPLAIDTDLPPDTGMLTNNKDAAPLVARDAPPVVDKDTGMAANNKDIASSATNTDAASPAVDYETGQTNAIQAINSGIGDAKCVDSEDNGEKKEKNEEGTPTLDEIGINLTKLGQEVTKAVNNTDTVPPSINTDAPPPIDGGIGIAANNKDPAPPAINSSDTGKDVNNKDAAPPAFDKDTSMATNNKDTASPAINADAAPPAVDNDLGKRDIGDAESVDTENNSEKKEKNEEGTPTLDKYGTNLTKLAQEGKLKPFDGREELVDRVIQVLCRQTKSSPCLIGHPCVGKTAIIEALAQRMQSGVVPERLKGKKVLSINSNPESETYCSRMLVEKIIEEIKRSSDILVYLDEDNTLYSTSVLKNSLARGDIQCIGATNTLGEYTKSQSLKRVFQAVEVPEPSMDDTIKILKGLRESYETHHKVRYTDEAFVAAVMLSSRYISDGILLDTSIDLIDEAGSRVQLLEAKTADTDHNNDDTPIIVTKEDVQHVVSSRTGIPVHEVSKEESERLLKLEETLHESIIGQHEALVAISDALRRSRVGLKSPKRPIASFIFTGPTGVGKTEVAKSLARQYFGSEDSMVRFDMSEYMQKHQVSKLIGAPPGYVRCREGGQLTEAVKRKPHTVVLFDEIEKAHPDVLNIMLQILEDGRLTDNKGETVTFSNTIIIMTSNVGGNVFYSESSREVPNEKIYNLVMKEIKENFRAEFLNRFDEIIIFKQLIKEEVSQIADLMFKEVGDRLKAKDIELNVSDKFRERLVNDGYSPSHGARQLRRVITTLLENLLAKKILSKEIKVGDSILLDVDSVGNIQVLKEPSSVRGE